MITKGIVEDFVNDYQVKVRLPIIDGIKGSKQATITKNLGNATICSLPNCRNNVTIGDIVFVGFEDNDLGKPIILGHLFKKVLSNTKIILDLNSLNVDEQAVLPAQTSIGDITPTDLANLSGTKGNLQAQIDNLQWQIHKYHLPFIDDSNQE